MEFKFSPTHSCQPLQPSQPLQSPIARRVWEMVLLNLMPLVEMKMLIALIIDRIVAGISHQEINGLFLF